MREKFTVFDERKVKGFSSEKIGSFSNRKGCFSLAESNISTASMSTLSKESLSYPLKSLTQTFSLSEQDGQGDTVKERGWRMRKLSSRFSFLGASLTALQNARKPEFSWAKIFVYLRADRASSFIPASDFFRRKWNLKEDYCLLMSPGGKIIK